MKILSLLLVLVGTAQSYGKNLEEFDKEFNILEAVPDDKKAEEAQLLKEAEAEIKAQNEAFDKGDGHFREKLTRFADMPQKDFESMKEGLNMDETRATGLIMPPESERNTPENQANLEVAYRELAMNRQAASWDSRAKGWITDAKNQGACGSCAAFAAHGVHEATMAKAGAKLDGLDLSEQYLVDCGYNGGSYPSMNGCRGAAPHAYSDWFANDGGMSPHESKYPYLGGSPKLTCTAANNVDKWNSGYKISKSYYDYGCTEDKLKQLVVAKGAVLTGVYASDSSFKGYESGVYDKCTRNNRESCNHAVVVVGYGTDANNGDYWIVKNSWGNNWGEKGFIKVKRGSTQCGIGTVCIWTDAAASGAADPAPAVTTTAAPPPSMWCDLTEVFNRWGYGLITGGPFNMRFWNGSKMIYSKINCQESKCTPAMPGPTNACQYICGRNTC